MYKAKHQTKNISRKSATAKIVALTIAICLLTVGVVGGTVAWLITQTDSVTNTFTYGDINITIKETDTNDGDGDETTNTYKMIPGSDIDKDPVITVLKDSEPCYLFAKVEKSTDPKFDDFMTYALADGWTQLKDANNGDVEGVFYREVPATAADTEFHVLAEDKVTVKEDVTKKMLNDLTAAGKLPTLTVTGYAVQQENIDSAYAAWIEIA